MDYFDWECSPAATNVASSWSNQLHQMGDSSLIESFHENLNQKSNHMVQKLAVTGSTDSPNNAAKFNYLWRQAAMKLAADSVLTKSGSSAETSSSAEFFSSAKRAHTIDPSTNGLISDLVMSELDYPQYIDDKATISTKTGSLESLDCLLSATNRNTNTSVQDDINSVLFSDGKKFWNLSSISALDSETNTANIKSNYCSSLTNKTTSQCSPKRSNQCIGIISEPKLKKSRLEKLLSSSNINFQQADNSSECTDCTEDHDSKTIVEMKEMLYRAAAFRPVNIEKMESVEKPKRKNVKISSDPQTVAARQRREKISEKIRVLQRLVPAGNKMDTASVLDEAANYLKFLRKMTGIEYALSEVMEPHLFVFRKQKRDSPEKVTPMLTYYVLDGSIYQAPQLCNVFASRVGHALYHISKAFTTAASKLEKIGYVDAESESAALEPKAPKETINFKELKRVDHILASLQRKLPPAPPPPPFPEGYNPPQSAGGENASEAQQAEQLPPVDPILEQGSSKRMKL